MSRNYSQFSVTDFVEDSFFRQWVLENSAETNRFWASFVVEHPEKSVAIAEAKEILAIMMKLPERNVTTRMTERAHEIKENIDKAIPYPLLHSDSFEAQPVKIARSRKLNIHSLQWLGIAASLLIGIILFGAITLSRNLSGGSTAQAQTIVQTSPKGKRSLISLPDQTKVWLNSESQLIYSRDFSSQNTREVFLVGEAFFDVTEDKSKPFIVNTSSIAIRVLGTAFNVRSYDEDKTVEATLLRGKISISMVDEEGNDPANDQAALLPNQRAVFIKKTKKLVLQNSIEAEAYSGWRAGKLYFDDKPIAEVLAMIERWYNVNIHVKSVPSERCTFSAKMDNKTLTEVLELFKTSANDSIEYVIEGKDVYITGEFCE